MTPSKNHIQSLDKAISSLENQRRNEFSDLKNQLHETTEHFRPINLLNQTIKDLRESTEIKNNLLETLMSVAGGYFSKKLIVGKSNSFFRKTLGFVLQYSVTNYISKKVNSNTNN